MSAAIGTAAVDALENSSIKPSLVDQKDNNGDALKIPSPLPQSHQRVTDFVPNWVN